MRGSGVKLVEVLGLVAISAVTAAVVFPLYTPTHDRHMLPCPSNMKQLGYAMRLYADDHDAHFPPRQVSAEVSWREAVLPYVKNRKCFSCGLVRHRGPRRRREVAWRSDPRGTGRLPTDYAINNAGDQVGVGKCPPSLAEIAEPSAKILLCELAGRPWSEFASPWWTFAPGAESHWGWSAGYAGHGTESRPLACYGYVDGHVQSETPWRTLAPVNGWRWTGTDADSATAPTEVWGTGELVAIDWVAAMRMVEAANR